MTTMTGPARLRQIAEFTILSAAELRQLAAQWEADLERAALDHAVALSKQADSLLRAERAEAALDAAKSQREAYKLSVYELREQLRHSVSEDALASAQDDLAGCRAALNSETNRADAAELTCYDKTTCRFAEEVRELRAELKDAQAKLLNLAWLARDADTERADQAEAALERARALLAEQAEIITANVWHIPPEYSARNIVMDAAAKMRDLAALLAAAPGGAA